MPYYNDDGTEINPGLFPKPQLCLSCKKNEEESEEILCNLTRIGQSDGEEFKCFVYEMIGK